MGQHEQNGGNPLAGLTAKQREVLDLLLEHKTSKEIARQLEISPHTVDQRIQFAKEKLGAASRNEAAMIYRRLVEICGQLTYENSHVAEAFVRIENGPGTQGSFPDRSHRERAHPVGATLQETDYSVVPELFEGRYGTLIRLGAILTIAVFLVFLVLGGLAIFSQLSELMAT